MGAPASCLHFDFSVKLIKKQILVLIKKNSLRFGFESRGCRCWEEEAFAEFSRINSAA